MSGRPPDFRPGAAALACGVALAAAAAASEPSLPRALPADAAGAAAAVRELLRQDLYEDALDLAGAAADRWPGEARLQVGRADALYRRGDFDDAERCYRRAVEMDPNDASAHFGVGRILRTQGRYAIAAESFSRAAVLAPEAPRHLRVLANHLARREDAIRMLERYLDLARTLPERGGEDENTVRNVEGYLALLRRMGDRPLSHLVKGEPCILKLQHVGVQPTVRLDIGKLKNQRFVFDTGATGMTISPRLAARAKLEAIHPFTITGTGERRTETGDLVVIDRLAAGEGIVLENVTATVREPTGTEEGLVGPSLFGSFDLRIDLKGGTLELRPAGSPRAGRSEPFRNVGGQIVIRAELQEVPLNAMVDTGATGTLVARSAVARAPGLQLLPGEWFRGENVGVGGRLADRKVLAEGSLSFAGRTYKAGGLVSGDLSRFSRAIESEIYLILGAQHLDDTPFTLSYRDMTVTFEDPPAKR
ncbi:MAG: aspartyl protease family protein [Candidatus Polarisedimenticolia bacterium]